MHSNHRDGEREGERLLHYLEQIIPEPQVKPDAFDMVVEPTAAAEAHRLLSWIEAALLPAIKRLRGAHMAGAMSRTVPAADFSPALVVELGLDSFEFSVSVIPMSNLVSFAWLDLTERRYDFGRARAFVVDRWQIGVLYEGDDGYEWRFIPSQYQNWGAELLHSLPVAGLPPLLPDAIRSFLEFIVKRCVEKEIEWRAADWRGKNGEGAG